jgi:hypothetical protein
MSAIDSTMSKLVERMMTRTRLEQAAPAHPTPHRTEHPGAAADLDWEVSAPGSEEPFMQAIAADFAALTDTIGQRTDMDAAKSRLYTEMRKRGEPR